MIEKRREPMPSSSKLAADHTLIPVWDPSVPFPAPWEMCDLDIVTHVTVERARMDGYHYLHEASIAWHHDRFHACWANHRELETGNNSGCLIRGTTSRDALRWEASSIWAQSPLAETKSINHPLLFPHGDRLYGFFACWRNEPLPTTEVFILNDTTGEWDWLKGAGIPSFVPFCTPQRLENGDWIIGGESFWYDAAVIISDGDDFSKWRMVKIPCSEDIRLLYPETAIINRGNNKLLAFCRPQQHTPSAPDAWTAPVSESHDGGETWSALGRSNFPMAASQPFAGTLSTGHHYLLTNNLEEGRWLLSIALTDSGDGLFRRIFKIRHQEWPAIRLFGGYNDGRGSFVGCTTEWSYPGAIEHNGNLYIIYTQGKEDCALSIVPIDMLTH